MYRSNYTKESIINISVFFHWCLFPIFLTLYSLSSNYLDEFSFILPNLTLTLLSFFKILHWTYSERFVCLFFSLLILPVIVSTQRHTAKGKKNKKEVIKKRQREAASPFPPLQKLVPSFPLFSCRAVWELQPLREGDICSFLFFWPTKKPLTSQYTHTHSVQNSSWQATVSIKH